MAIKAAFMVPHPPMIVPAVGKGSEEQVIKTANAYDEVAKRIAEIKPDTIIISSPHAPMYGDYINMSSGKGDRGSLADFRAPEVKFDETYDSELVAKIETLASLNRLDAGTLGRQNTGLDHGTMVPLYFIEKYYKDFKLVRIGLSGLALTKHYELGMLVAKACEELGRNAVYVASGDLSHKLQVYGPYGFAPEGPEYDKRIMDVAGRAAFEEMFDFDETFCEKAAECGHRSFVMMAGALDGKSLKTEVLSHEDVTGVGYGIATFEVTGNDENRHFLKSYMDRHQSKLNKDRENADEYVKLAAESVEYYLKTGRMIDMKDCKTSILPEMKSNRAGAFVSIHEHGRLRGCIGTILPVTDCLAEEIIRNAVSASTEDPRFNPIEPDELPWLEINVDVLSTPEPIKSEAELDPKKYGVIVTNGRRRGLLLPDLDGVDTVERQISISKQKAGIAPDEPVELQRFTVTRHV
ncbi:MAG: AmmeMemoRadiSam system protein A [Lachnospiraceae bacterium]|nr:AmmeMemoRadiSam system protein A [Lachnospiraceae bacterium]